MHNNPPPAFQGVTVDCRTFCVWSWKLHCLRLPSSSEGSLECNTLESNLSPPSLFAGGSSFVPKVCAHLIFESPTHSMTKKLLGPAKDINSPRIARGEVSPLIACWRSHTFSAGDHPVWKVASCNEVSRGTFSISLVINLTGLTRN